MAKMALIEAIKHCEEKAKELRKNEPIFRYAADEKEADKCLECAEEHEQLAKWLKELKAYQELFESPEEAKRTLEQLMV